jgi:hypothetical protein
MRRRKISYAFAGKFGVPLAPIPDVTFAELKMGPRGPKGAIRTCYNGRRINDLETAARMAKMGPDLYGHPLGDKVKSVIPAGSRS